MDGVLSVASAYVSPANALIASVSPWHLQLDSSLQLVQSATAVAAVLLLISALHKKAALSVLLAGAISTIAWAYHNAYSTYSRDFEWPSPIGLSLGIGCVAVGQVFVVAYHYVQIEGHHPVRMIQHKTKSPGFWSGLAKHVANAEGLVMLGSYLSFTWMLNLMPASYYSHEGPVSWPQVALCLLLMDFLQTAMHMLEHIISPVFYRNTHKPHHRFTNPNLFDAFDGSFWDTLFMILVPIFTVARVVHCNVWTYMAFGTCYSSLLVLIHAEYSHPWDPLFRLLGLGTAGDHHVHHKVFKSNFGHTTTYFDRFLRTYKSPLAVRSFNKDI